MRSVSATRPLEGVTLTITSAIGLSSSRDPAHRGLTAADAR